MTQPTLPSLETVHTKHVPTLKYVPKQLRTMWSQCLARSLAAVAHHNDLQHWVELQMLTKCVLCAPARAGKQHSSQRLAFTRSRLQKWLDGERSTLWQSLPTYKKQGGSNSSSSNPSLQKALKQKRCEDFCREGADSKACKALTSAGLLEPDAVLGEMLDKHPAAAQAPDLRALGPLNTGLAPSVDIEDLVGALKSFNKHSGAGPSGLRPWHLTQSLGPAHSDQVLEHLANVLNIMIRGQAHQDVAPWLCGAVLMALPKKDGSARPVAVGETLRRLAAKVLCKSCQGQARTYLWPLQIGVALPLGAEVGAQVARQWCQRNQTNPDKVFVKLDFANAFNTVNRQTFLTEVRNRLPGLAPWVEYCYSSPSKLVFGSHTISSETGVQQGDPLGPLLFSLALQPILAELAGLRAPGGLELVYSYLDDLCLAGEASAVSNAVERLRRRCNDVGLQLSTGAAHFKDKCELILVAGAASTVDVAAFPSDFKVVRDGNFELLGAPIGSPEFCNEHTRDRVGKAARILQALGELPDPQVALQLLRRCAGFSKMVFSLRSVPPSFHSAAVANFDDQVRACFEEFTCLHPDNSHWEQASLSTNNGGLGLRSLSQHSHAAFLASRTSCLELCQQLDPAHTLESPCGDASVPPERSAFTAYNQVVNDDDQLQQLGSEKLSQKKLSGAVDKRSLAHLRNSACRSRRAHLDLVCADGAGLYMHATPCKAARLDNDPALYVAMLRRRLRIAFAESDVECPFCDGVLDRYGDHALVCCAGGDRTRRHNLLRNMVFHAADAARLHPELEKPGLLRPRPLCGATYESGASVGENDGNTDARRPADVYVPRWRLGPPAAWDFAVTSGLRLDLPVEVMGNADGVTARYEDYKCSHNGTRADCQVQGISFIPMIVEAVGGSWGKMARCVWSELAKNYVLASGELATEDTCATMLQQRLSMTLHRENARACLRRF